MGHNHPAHSDARDAPCYLQPSQTRAGGWVRSAAKRLMAYRFDQSPRVRRGIEWYHGSGGILGGC